MAILVVLTFLAGGLAGMPVASAAPSTDEPYVDGLQKVTLTTTDTTHLPSGGSGKEYDAYYGTGAIVTFGFTSSASDIQNVDVRATAFDATTKGSFGPVPVTKGIKTSSEGHYYTGRIAIGGGSTSDAHALSVGAEKPHIIEIDTKGNGIRHIVWFPTNDATVSHPAPTSSSKTIWGGEVSVHLTDKDFRLAKGDGTTDCTSSFGIHKPSFLARAGNGPWQGLAYTCRDTDTADKANFTVDVSSVAPRDHDTVTLRIEDPYGKDGRPLVHDVTYTFRTTADGIIKVYDDDHRTEVSTLSGINAKYVVRVIDPDADLDPTKLGTVSVTATSNLDSIKLTLTQTRPDGDEFQGLLTLSPFSTADTLRVSADNPGAISFSYLDARDASNTADPVERSLVWSATHTASVTLASQDPSFAGVVFGSSTVPTGATFTPTSSSGAYLKVVVTDTDGGVSNLVVRNGELSDEDCNAREFDSNADVPETLTNLCRVLKLQPSSGSSHEGYIFFTTGSVTPNTVAKDNWIDIQVADLDTVHLGFRDMKTADGSEKIISKTAVWRDSFDGAVKTDKPNYFVGDTVTVTLVDPDQTNLGSKTVIARVADAGTPPPDAGTEFTLQETATKGTYQGTFTIGTSSGQLDARDGQIIRLSYDDPSDASGKQDRKNSPDVSVFGTGSGALAWDRTLAAGRQDVNLTLTDSNAGQSSTHPIVSVGSAFGHPTLKDTVHFTGTSSPYTHRLQSDFITKTISAKPAKDTDPTGGCQYEIALGEPFEAGLIVRQGTDYFAPKDSLSADKKEFRPLFASGKITFYQAQLGTVVNPSCGTNSLVDDKTFTITYVPAARVTEHFIGDGSAKTYPLARYLGVQNIADITDDRDGTPNVALDPVRLPVTSNGVPMTLQDTDPIADGRRDGTNTRLFFTDAAGDNVCTFLKIRINGVEKTCSDTLATAGSTATNAGTAEIVFKTAPGLNDRVSIEYLASAYRRVSTVDVSSETLPDRAILAGSFRYALLDNQDPTDDKTFEDLGITSTTALNQLVKDGKLPTGTAAQCPCTYRTELFHDNRVPFGEPVDHGFDHTLTAKYTDGQPGAGTATSTSEVGLRYADSRNAKVFFSDRFGDESRIVAGMATPSEIRVDDPGQNKDVAVRDSVTVSVVARPYNATGYFDATETETFTLLETGSNTGLFRAKMPTETTKTANNGKLHIGSFETLEITVTYAAAGKELQGWLFAPGVAGLDLGTKDQLKGTSSPLPITVTDPDAGNRVIAHHVTKASIPNADKTTKHLKYTLPTGFAPLTAESARVYVCADDDPSAAGISVGKCTLYTKTSGDPTGSKDPDAGKFFVKASSGQFKLGGDFTGSSDFLVRIDFRTSSTADTVPVKVNVFDRDGVLRPGSSGSFTLSETGTNTNVFRLNLGFCRIGDAGCTKTATKTPIDDGDTLTVSYTDVNYDRAGTGASKACITPFFDETTECLFRFERSSAATSLLQKSIGWSATDNGILTIRSLDGTKDLTAAGIHIQGAQKVNLTLDDKDRDTKPDLVETVTVTLTGSNGGAVGIVLRETTAASGIFQEEIVPSNIIGFSADERINVRYDDPAGLSGNPVTVRLMSSQKVDDLLWRSADTGLLDAREARFHVGPTVADPLTFSVIDPDRSTSKTTPDTIASGAFKFWLLDRTRADHVALGQAVAYGSAAGQVSLQNDVALETQPHSGVFETNVDVSRLIVQPGQVLRVVYTDQHDINGEKTEVVQDFIVYPTDAGLPRFSQDRYESLTDEVVVTLKETSALHADAKDQVNVSIHVGSLGQDPTKLTLKKSASETYTAKFVFQEKGDLPVIPVQFDQIFYVTYDDVQAGSKDAGFGGAQSSMRLLDVARLVEAGSEVASTAKIIAGTVGESEGWYTSPPTVRLSATENAARLDHFEYRFAPATSWTTCGTTPCDIIVNEEGVHELFWRSVDRLGDEEAEQSIDVNFDKTAPTAQVSSLNATSGPAGAIELSWTSGVDPQDPMQFGSYKVWLGDTTGAPVGNSTTTTFSHTPAADGEHTYLVAIADKAGNVDKSKAVEVKGLSDRVAPTLTKAGALQTEIREEEDALRADLYASLDTLPSDFDKVIVKVTAPAGGNSTEITLTRVGTSLPANFTGAYTGFTATGTYSFAIEALDKAGNADTEVVTVKFIGIDKTPPVFNVPATVEEGQNLVATLVDNDSGVVSAKYKLGTGDFITVDIPSATTSKTVTIATAGLALGEYTITWEATDLNGNKGEGTATFEVVEPGTTPPTPGKPTIVLITPTVSYPYLESGGTASFRVESATPLSALSVKVGDAAPADLLAQWVSSTNAIELPTSGLPPGAHVVTVSASNAAGDSSVELTVTVLEPGLPLPAKNVRVSQVPGTTHLKVDWDPSPSSDVDGYLIHRSSSPFKVIAVVDALTTSFVDKTTKAGATYAYQVTAYSSENGKLDVGADSDAFVAPFASTQSSPAKVIATGGDDDGFFASYWWVFLILLGVLVAVSMVYVYRDRLFGSRQEAEEEDLWADHGDASGAFADDDEEALAAQFGVTTHDVRCPKCTTEFSVSGEKPIVTNCPNCGGKGILR